MEVPTEFVQKLYQALQQFGAGIAIVLAAIGVYIAASRGLQAVQKRQHLPDRLVSTLRRILRWGIVLATVILMLQAFGLLQSVVAAVTGVLALVAIGFVAVWSVLSNTLCSLILIITRPFRVGDTLTFPPDTWGGKVVNFNMLFTTLETEDGSFLQVPNNTFFQRPMLRSKGQEQIMLGEQLYRRQNASVGQESGHEEHANTELFPVGVS